uniref:histidine kinase n=1 Tax=Magnetococcus massalia (strain MO-1) TaxID=451514 RepID=A0A1S7LGE6_MAGMO|nr:Putative Histidine kinase with PAS 4 domain, PAS domain, HisKA domain, HATPase c domain and response regulator receiver domain [Candidatus Magnetococcus massalia]
MALGAMSKGLSRQLSIQAFIIAFALGLFASSLQIVFDLQQEQRSMDRTVNQILNIVSHSAAQATYQLDERMAKEVLDSLFAFGPIRWASLRDDFGHQLAKRTSLHETQITRSLALWLFDEKSTYRKALYIYHPKEQVVGELTVELDIPRMASDFISRALVTLLDTLARTIGLTLVLMLLFHSRLAKPLRMMIEDLDRTGPNHEARSGIHPPIGHEQDELGELAAHMDSMLIQYRQVLGRSRQDEARLRAVVNALPDLVFLVNQDVRCMEILTTHEGLLRNYALQAPGKTLEAVFVHDQQPLLANPIALTLQTGRLQTVEFSLMGVDKEHTFEARLTPFGHSGEKAPTSVVMVARDISTQREALAQLKDQIQFQHVLLDNIPTPVFYKDAIGHYLGCNKAFEDVLGMTRNELVGKTVFDIVTSDMARHYDKTDQSLFVSGGTQSYETVLVYADGLRHDIILNKGAFYNNKGEVAGLVGVIQDISDRKRMESQLRQARKMEAVGTLAGGIAHDFNNILSAILGFTELTFSQVPEGSRAWRNLRQVYDAGTRARDLVKRLLDFSRPSDEGMIPMDPTTVVREALTLLRATLPSSIRIETDVPDMEILVRADPTQMQQVLMNLCTNAARAMRKNQGGTLAVSLHVIDHADALPEPLTEGSYVHLSVQDTGCGIPAHHLEHIFDPFFTTSKLGEGTGLGLSVVHGIVNKHGGAVTVESTEEVGSTFHVFLPTLDSRGLELDNKREEKSILESRRVEIPQGIPEASIMLVDDEPDVLEAAQLQLKRAGFEVHPYLDPQEAWSHFQAQPDAYDLVITDHNMPGMVGSQLAKQILSVVPQFPVVLCTGYSEELDADKAKAMGISSYLMKPLLGRELVEEATRLLLDDHIQGRSEEPPKQ